MCSMPRTRETMNFEADQSVVMADSERIVREDTYTSLMVDLSMPAIYSGRNRSREFANSVWVIRDSGIREQTSIIQGTRERNMKKAPVEA